MSAFHLFLCSQRYYTEQTVQSGETCDARVAAERERIKASSSATLGVIPTVSLGMAMLIFALVGTFAAGIAQAFQLVRRYVYHDADNLDTAFDAGGKGPCTYDVRKYLELVDPSL